MVPIRLAYSGSTEMHASIGATAGTAMPGLDDAWHHASARRPLGLACVFTPVTDLLPLHHRPSVYETSDEVIHGAVDRLPSAPCMDLRLVLLDTLKSRGSPRPNTAPRARRATGARLSPSAACQCHKRVDFEIERTNGSGASRARVMSERRSVKICRMGRSTMIATKTELLGPGLQSQVKAVYSVRGRT